MTRRILVAGLGNVFFGDDGFGVEVAKRLQGRAMPEGVEVADFGIRGMDLAYALLEGYDALILVDAATRGEPPGTLSMIEHQDEDTLPTLDTHGMDPVKVFTLARALGAPPTPTYVVACEPAVLTGEGDEDVVVGLSGPVEAAVAEALEMVESLVARLCSAELPGPVRSQAVG